LSGQPVEIAPSVPGIALTFRCDSLPREQVLYGLELLFGVNRLAVVPQESGPGLRIVVTGVSTKN
jgi:hypothetical protein